MACTLLRCIFLLSCLMAIEVCLARSLTDHDDHHHHHILPNSAKKVPVNLYYETLCPGCQEFILEGLPPLFKNELIDIIELRLVPWGNARVHSNQSFVCQHGPPECFLNTVEACAIDAWPTPLEYFPFILCVENLASEGKHTEWETCFTKLGLDPKPVKDCSSSDHGKQLELKYAKETKELKPQHEFVPWVVVNKQPLKEDIGNLITYICRAYKGTPPSACHDKSSSISTSDEAPHVYPACYATKDQNNAHP
ncbi:gamma-interferon-responsive lysosomal thiol protein-like [Silene latifolia]|uniref:gamma-interferon-responsive lysosomal thiol protein-like n=1 Tax=Silene latifolia TaxID=37657 RepID=UPI003D783D8C